MSRDEVIDNLGTIARSGTAAFLEQLSGDQQKDSQLIGQFGVGFYSSFIVAERVTVHTRKAGLDPAEGVLWESAGEAEFSIEPREKDTRGTDITLYLRDDCKDFADDWRVRSVIKKYSDHISVPVMMKEAPPPPAGDEDEKAQRASRNTPRSTRRRRCGHAAAAISATRSTRPSTSTCPTTSRTP
jgi:molecular chaperone HtpG